MNDEIINLPAAENDTEESFDNLVIQPLSKSANQSNVWRHYKRLFKRYENNVIAPVRKALDRIVCAECFNGKKIVKRYKIFQ